MLGFPRSDAISETIRRRRAGRPGGNPGEHIPKSIEPSASLRRIRVAGRFVHSDVAVIGCIRFRGETSCRTKDREASTKGTAVPGFSGAGTCGGVMVRGPASGNGKRSSVYYLDSAGLDSPRPRPRALDTGPVLGGELDLSVADMQADGSLAARPGIGGSWRGAGGRSLLWPTRVVLW